MLSLGLTGGIGAGKSTVARRLAAHGAIVVDADRLARDVVAAGTPGLAAVVAAFGPEVLATSGELDRPALGRIVFADTAARHRLEQITHPLIAAATSRAFAGAPADAVGVHDVPLLVEKQMGTAYHLVIVVHADRAERMRRLVQERGMSTEEVLTRMAAQADDAARRAAADIWLDNSSTPDLLRGEVDRLWRDRLRPYAHNLAARRPAHRTEAADLTAAAVARLAERLRWRLGPAAESVEAGPDRRFTVRVADPVALDGVRPRLEAAGYARLERDDGHRYASCDPGCGVELSVLPLTV